MDRVETAHRDGVAEARRDIAAGCPRLRYGARGAWGDDLAETLRVRFGVELVPLSCLTDAATGAFVAGYNRTVEAHVDRVHGAGSVAAARDAVQRRRLAACRAWAARAGLA